MIGHWTGVNLRWNLLAAAWRCVAYSVRALAGSRPTRSRQGNSDQLIQRTAIPLLCFAIALLASTGAQAQSCEELCPSCVGRAPFENCTARDECRKACANPPPLAPVVVAPPSIESVVSDLKSKVLKLLGEDATSAKEKVTTSVTGSREAADRYAAAADAEFARQLDDSAAMTRASIFADLNGRISTIALLVQKHPAQLLEAAQCLGTQLPWPVKQAYSETQAWMTGQINALQVQRMRTDQHVSEATTIAKSYGNAFSSRVESAFRDIAPNKAIEAEVTRLESEIAGLTASEDNARKLRSWLNGGFGNWNTFVDIGKSVGTDALALAKAGVDSATAGLVSTNRATHEAALRAAERRSADAIALADPARMRSAVKALGDLPGKVLYAQGSNKLAHCLCRHLDILPMDMEMSENAMALLSNRAKALCFAHAALRWSESPQLADAKTDILGPGAATASSNTSGRMAGALPSNTSGNVAGFMSPNAASQPKLLPKVPEAALLNPNAALSPDGLRELRQKADLYEKILDELHFNAGVLYECVLTDQDPSNGFQFHRFCGDDANMGQISGKLLAARAYKYSVLMDASDPAANQALSRLYASLAGVINIMSMASAQTGITRITGQVSEDFGPNRSGAHVNGVPGLPVRNYVPVPMGRGESFHLQSSADNSLCAFAALQGGPNSRTWPRFDHHDYYTIGSPNQEGVRDANALAKVYNYEGCILNERHELLAGRFRFKERESGDDTPATLVGLAAAYDVLKRWNPNDPLARRWRETIVTSAEAFGLYWVRPEHAFTFKTLADPNKPLADPNKPFEENLWDYRLAGQEYKLEYGPRVLFNLAVLRVVLYLSDDHWGTQRQEISSVRKKYEELWKLRADAIRRIGIWSPIYHLPLFYRFFIYASNSFSVEIAGLSSHLLSKYEIDPKRRCDLRNRLHRDVRPFIADWRNLALDYMFVLNAERTSQCISFDPDPVFLDVDPVTAASSLRPPVRRSAVLAQAASILRLYRPRPAPFDNPMPETDDPTEQGYWYTDFSKSGIHRDIIYRWIVDAPGAEKPRISGDQGALIALGPGLVPKGVESGPFALIGGDWDADNGRVDLFHKDWPTGVKMPAPHEYIFAYWFGRAHKLLAE